MLTRLPKLQAENGHRVRIVKERAEAQGWADLALITKAGVPLISNSAAPNLSNLGPKCVLEAVVPVGERTNLMCQQECFKSPWCIFHMSI